MTVTHGATDALDKLVNQFTDPLSFYRELVQNSIDAGSAEVDISLEHRDGVMRIHVDDYGEGMNREIIDTRLTRLFSSRKDGDLTKIGKFGIGFVSVFAIEPDAVSVDTSRDGENWRIVFRGDRTFTRIAKDEPVEGTKITVFKQVPAEEFQHFVERSRDVVAFWCRYVDAGIRFQGELVTQPFRLDSPCQVRHREEGTEIVVGYRRDLEPTYGFYNEGLTLREGKGIFSRRSAFMVNSRHLEHTMARDDVRQDESFDHIMAAVDRLVREELPSHLLALVRTAQEQPTSPELPFLCRALAREIGPERRWSWAAADLAHGGGHQEGDSWVAIPGEDHCQGGVHLVYGPYERGLAPGPHRAHWWLSLEGGEPESEGVHLGVYDAASKRSLAGFEVMVRDTPIPGEQHQITLAFDCPEGASIELRTHWHRKVTVRQTRAAITTRSHPSVDRTPYGGLSLYSTPSGRPVDLATVEAAAKADRLFLSSQSTELAKIVETSEDAVVLNLAPDDPRTVVVEALAGGLPADVDRRFCLPRPAAAADLPGWNGLRLALAELLRAAEIKVATVVLGSIDEKSPVREWVGVSVDRLGELAELATATRLEGGLLARSRTLVLNRDHPTVGRLLQLGVEEPEMAAYLLAKLFFLRSELDPPLDTRLATAAWSRRWTRSKG